MAMPMLAPTVTVSTRLGFDRARQRIDDALRRDLRALVLVDALEQHGEFVAAEP